MAAKEGECATSSESFAASEANNHLAVHLYKLLAKTDMNVFFSPFSLSTSLAMLFCACERETAEEMRQVLGYAAANMENSDIKRYFQSLLNDIESHSDSYTLAYANSVLSAKSFCVKQDFKSLLEESFNALIKEVDFINGAECAVRQINAWVAQKTNNMMQKLLHSLESDTVMMILNAVYFKGFWLNQFQKKDTYLQEFYNMNGNVKKVEMMHVKEKFPYSAKETFKVLELPYKGNEIAMLILLPNSRDGLNDIEASLSTSMIFDLKREMYQRKVKVCLPKFRLEYMKPLKEQFQIMGMNRAFCPGADFDGISDSKELYVSEVIHKAVLEVNEEGAEAAVATAILIAKRCFKPDPEFIVDHPFLFIIYNVKNDIILFMGRVGEL